MILTLTLNPALDQTVQLADSLAPGEVHRAVQSSVQAAGKGVNVARAIAQAGEPTLAVLPGADDDPLVLALAADALAYRNIPIDARLRTNITLADPAGVTTKINEPGPALEPQTLDQVLATLIEHAEQASWVVLAGSLPPGVAEDYYLTLTQALREALGESCPPIAMDTSDAPLLALRKANPASLPDLIKPNAQELAELTGTTQDLEADLQAAAAAAATLVDRGVGVVLATLGSAGAVLVSSIQALHAVHEPVTARSTVGAGDSALAGFLLASSAGDPLSDCLIRAVAYGSAAVALPGSTIPTPNDLTVNAVSLRDLHKAKA
ncbi:hexose kinase [Glutamicibacter endophyticus]